MFFEDFFILFLHSLENVDFIKIAVFLQENNVFNGSEGSKFLYLLLFFEAFSSTDFRLDFSSISEAIWAYFSDFLASFFDTFQASIFYLIFDVVFNDFGSKMGSDSMGRGLHFTTFFLTSISASIWTSLLNDFRLHFGGVFELI